MTLLETLCEGLFGLKMLCLLWKLMRSRAQAFTPTHIIFMKPSTFKFLDLHADEGNTNGKLKDESLEEIFKFDFPGGRGGGWTVSYFH